MTSPVEQERAFWNVFTWTEQGLWATIQRGQWGWAAHKGPEGKWHSLLSGKLPVRGRSEENPEARGQEAAYRVASGCRLDNTIFKSLLTPRQQLECGFFHKECEECGQEIGFKRSEEGSIAM